MKSIKDFNPKFGTVNYRTDICIIAIEQNTSYSMAASEVVEIYIRENQQQNLHLEAATWSRSGKRCSQDLGKIPGKCLQRGLTVPAQ